MGLKGRASLVTDPVSNTDTDRERAGILVSRLVVFDRFDSSSGQVFDRADCEVR